jgi:hypothetical protein
MTFDEWAKATLTLATRQEIEIARRAWAAAIEHTGIVSKHDFTPPTKPEPEPEPPPRVFTRATKPKRRTKKSD